MNNSLQDQLLKAGLVDKKKAKQASKEKRKKTNTERRTKAPIVDENKEAIAQAQKEKQLRDKALNAKRQADADKKALTAQVTQLIQHYRLKNAKGEKEYNFKDGTKIKTIRLHENIVDEVIRGRLCIARLQDNYEIIPKPVADKICERDDSAIVVSNAASVPGNDSGSGHSLDDKSGASSSENQNPDSDDAYYAQFEIPDDLSW